MNATYRQHEGVWHLAVTGGTPEVGAQIAVAKKDGSTKMETVGSVVWSGITRSGQPGALCTIAGQRAEPVSVDGERAIRGQHWSQRGHGPAVRLCASGCGRRVGPRYAECYSCHRESMEAL